MGSQGLTVRDDGWGCKGPRKDLCRKHLSPATERIPLGKYNGGYGNIYNLYSNPVS